MKDEQIKTRTVRVSTTRWEISKPPFVDSSGGLGALLLNAGHSIVQLEKEFKEALDWIEILAINANHYDKIELETFMAKYRQDNG